MKAFVVPKPGATPRISTLERPRPGPGTVLIEIAACGLNYADLLLSDGRYQEMPPFPLVPGMEVAGEIAALGTGVDPGLLGRRVAAFTGSGGLAEAVAVAAGDCVTLPEKMPMTEAAGFLVAYGTAHLALTRRIGLRPGERLLVLGAAGGAGQTAVEIGRLIGAEVVACARGPDKCAAAAAAGAHHIIDSATEDIRTAVKALGGADAVYDPVGGAQFEAAFGATKPGGRILVIGFASGDVPQIKANHLLVKNISLHGFNWGAYRTLDADALMASLTELMAWYAGGRLTPPIGEVLPFDRAAEGLDLIRNRQAKGKIVVALR